MSKDELDALIQTELRIATDSDVPFEERAQSIDDMMNLINMKVTMFYTERKRLNHKMIIRSLILGALLGLTSIVTYETTRSLMHILLTKNSSQ